MNYICVEGNIGAGKTTFVNRFAELTGRTPILERFSDNPFLASFYENPEQYAFPLEMSFLAERFQHLNGIFNSPDLFSRGYVADYSFLKTLIFAEINLKKEEFELFRRFYTFLQNQLPKPDLIIYLDSEIHYLQANIVKRGRSYEQNIKPEYLDEVKLSYKSYLLSSAANKKVVINYSQKDWLRIDEIINEILTS